MGRCDTQGGTEGGLMRALLALLVALSATATEPLHAARPGEPIQDFRDIPVHTRGARPSLSQVREAIVSAGTQVMTVGGAAWQMEDSGPGELVGTLRWGGPGHVAEITVTYSVERYSVVYRGSTNLGYEAEGRNIHPNYNKLVRTLVFKIQSTLAAVDGDPNRVVASRRAPATPGAAARADAVQRSGPVEIIVVSV